MIRSAYEDYAAISNVLTYEEYCAAWNYCLDQLNFFSEDKINSIYDIYAFGKSERIIPLQQRQTEIVHSLLPLLTTDLGHEVLAPLYLQLEKLNIMLLGHNKEYVRIGALKILTCLYDGHDWELTRPFNVSILQIGDVPFIEFVGKKDVSKYSLFISTLCYNEVKEFKLHPINKDSIIIPRIYKYSLVQEYNEKLKTTTFVPSIQFPPLQRNGFFDVRVIDNDIGRTVYKHRYIVLPQNVNQERIHEILVDLEGIKVDKQTGQIIKTGDFQSIRKKLNYYKNMNVTTLYLLGALQRTNTMTVKEAFERTRSCSVCSDSDTEGLSIDFPPIITSTNENSLMPSNNTPIPIDTVSNYNQYNNYNSPMNADSSLDHENDAYESRNSDLVRSKSFSDIIFVNPQNNVSMNQTAAESHRCRSSSLDSYCNQVESLSRSNSINSELSDNSTSSATQKIQFDSNATSVLDRAFIDQDIGGFSMLNELIQDAAKKNIRVMLQMENNINTYNYSSKYKVSWFPRYYNENNCICFHEGYDGHENQWNDQLLLNYRMVDVWNVLIEDILSLTTSLHIGGICLRDDSQEMLRKDCIYDSNKKEYITFHHYKSIDVLNGLFVQHDKEGGYYDLPVEYQAYASPLLLKLSHILYQYYDNFLLTCTCSWNRSSNCLTSGVVPIDTSFISHIYNLLGMNIEKNGNIRLLTEEEKSNNSVRALFYPNNYKNYNKQFLNDLQHYTINYICNEYSPYPLLLLQRAAWTAIDMLYTYPGIQSTFIGEQEGNGYKIQVGNIYTCNNMIRIDDTNNDDEEQYDVYDDKESYKQCIFKPFYAIHLVTTFDFELEDTYKHVYIIGSFNNWNKGSNKMMIKEHIRNHYLFEYSCYLEPGMHMYKYYILDNDTCVHDKTKPVIEDHMGGFNNVLNIPIPKMHSGVRTHPENIADVFWGEDVVSNVHDVLEEKELSNNGPIYVSSPVATEDENNTIRTVTTWKSSKSLVSLNNAGKENIPTSSSTKSVPHLSQSPVPVGYVNDNLGNLPQLQMELSKKLGSEYGFDNSLIYRHYYHRQGLKDKYPVLINGNFILLSDSSNKKIVSYIRYLKDEFFLVISSFESNVTQIDITLKDEIPNIEELAHMRDNNEMSSDSNITGLWQYFDAKDGRELGYITDYELYHMHYTSTIDPYSSYFYYYRYHKNPETALKDAYFYSSLIKIEDLFKNTQNNGCNLHNEYDIIHRIHPSDDYVLKELGNVMLFKQMMNYIDRFSKGDTNQIRLLLEYIRDIIVSVNKRDVLSFSDCIYKCIFYIQFIIKYDSNLLYSTIESLAHDSSVSSEIQSFANSLLSQFKLGPIVFITPELGKWSTVGGLGTIVDLLSHAIAKQNQEVIVISPYYDRDRKGNQDYLKKDYIFYKNTIDISTPYNVNYSFGIHEGYLDNIHYYFYHNLEFYRRPYPSGDNIFMMKNQVVTSLISLEIILRNHIQPSIIVTNDWPTCLISAYARTFYKDTYLKETSFFHIFHNLDVNYEGRIYLSQAQNDMYWIHHLNTLFLIDPYWKNACINPSRSVLFTTDNWATVSNTYKQEILDNAALRYLLHQYPHSFGTPNGLNTYSKLLKYSMLPYNTHETAKKYVQQTYFNYTDSELPLFVFIGRITEQKGVHLILDTFESVLSSKHKVQLLIGGMASEEDPYGRYCIYKMNQLKSQYPKYFWADPSHFFTDGFVCNLASDFGLMPSLFEPSGLVQHEFFIAGTPVIAFKTGGLAETVNEWNSGSKTGNGFLFTDYTIDSFKTAVERALGVFKDPETYSELRKSCVPSALDVSQQARDYICEFNRLRRIITINCRTSFSYHLKPEDPVPRHTYLVGTFTDWQSNPIEMNYNNNTRTFTTSMELKPGRYLYKFIVDDQWKCSYDQEICKDQFGNENHFCTVCDNRNIILERNFKGNSIFNNL